MDWCRASGRLLAVAVVVALAAFTPCFGRPPVARAVPRPAAVRPVYRPPVSIPKPPPINLETFHSRTRQDWMDSGFGSRPGFPEHRSPNLESYPQWMQLITRDTLAANRALDARDATNEPICNRKLSCADALRVVSGRWKPGPEFTTVHENGRIALRRSGQPDDPSPGASEPAADYMARLQEIDRQRAKRGIVLSGDSSKLVDRDAMWGWLTRDYFSASGGVSSTTFFGKGKALGHDLGLPREEHRNQVIRDLLAMRVDQYTGLTTHKHGDHFKPSNQQDLRAHWSRTFSMFGDPEAGTLVEVPSLWDTLSSDVQGAAPAVVAEQGRFMEISFNALSGGGDRSVRFLLRRDGTSNPNDTAVMTRLQAGRITQLRCSDVTPRTLALLMDSTWLDEGDRVNAFASKADVLYWPHHAWVPRTRSDIRIMRRFLEVVQPRFVIIHNRHPTQSRSNIDSIRLFVRESLGDGVHVISTEELGKPFEIISRRSLDREIHETPVVLLS